jgi:pimeloyl-ACP methyl ester carboxylesterase
MSDNGNTVYFETRGNGPPIILIHGMGASLRQWDYLMPQLVAAGFSAYALDLQGHGNSPKPSGAENYHIETLFDQLNLWIENLGLKRPAIMIGHSFGGYLSLMYALRNPQKVHALVLADPFYSPFQLSPLIRYFAHQPRISIRVLEWLPTWMLDMSMYWSEKFQQALPSSVRRQLVMDYKRTTPFFLNVTQTVKDLTPQLSQVQQPTLVTWGSQDMTLAPESFPKIVEELPDVKSYIFQGGGHIPHLTRTNSFNQLVLGFVTSFKGN